MPIDPTQGEDDYFKFEDIEKVRKARKEASADIADTARAEAKEAHWMRCPKCGMELAEIEYRGVQVDNCFNCGGMFLDAGEAEKIMAFEEPGELGKMFSFLIGKK